MILAPVATWASALLTLALSSPPVTPPLASPVPVPALEIIKVYGSLASPECYGRTAPPGSSCQLPRSYLEKELGLLREGGGAVGSRNSLDYEGFARRLSDLPFRWPLKPYGLTDDSLRKTTVMNKGAETALYMDELERRGLYDRRNPAGPLPTSLRPRLNAQLDKEGVSGEAVGATFRALCRGGDEMNDETLKEAFGGRDALDYYGFVELLGERNISWPKKER